LKFQGSEFRLLPVSTQLPGTTARLAAGYAVERNAELVEQVCGWWKRSRVCASFGIAAGG
jgi:hypothetical protein